MSLSFQPLGDTGIRVGMGNEISEETNRCIRGYCNWLQREAIPGVVEWVPTYCAVTVYYHPHQISYQELCNRLCVSKEVLEETGKTEGTVTVLPVVYGGEYGPDLEDVAQFNGLTPSEVIAIHTQPLYRVYMIGFAPGFPYLGGMSEAIATPRLEHPRLRIPAGSVGIAGSQTGVYSLESPGGWRIIGRTLVRLYDPYREVPAQLKAGDFVRFQAVDS